MNLTLGIPTLKTTLSVVGWSIILCLIVPTAESVRADEASARLVMEEPGNPLIAIDTAAGMIFVEMLRAEAPSNVDRFLALTAGEIEIADRDSGQLFSPRYYDGMSFHRVLPGTLIQAGSPVLNAFGAPRDLLPDEINANALGLDRRPAVLPDGSFNPLLQISDRQSLEDKILAPMYRAMDISSPQAVENRQIEIDGRLRQMTVKQVYQNQGYRYTERLITRPIVRGTMALANRGPDTNGPEFFIAVTNADWLWGRYTVIGRVVEGMDIVDLINQDAVDPLDGDRGTLIYSIREL